MDRQQCSWADLAIKLHTSVGSVKVEHAKGWTSRFVRAAVEDIFDRPVFSSQREFQKRKEHHARLGLCPIRATRAELFALARRIGVSDPTHYPNRKTLLSDLLARAAVTNRHRT